MSTNSQDESSSGESEDDESESSSLDKLALSATGSTLEHETLKAVYQKWRLHVADETSASTSSTNSVVISSLPQHSSQVEPVEKPRRTSIDSLPYEVLLHIFRWAVGVHMDTRILGRLAQVCRGFYLLSCDPFLWRSVCFRQWPHLFSQDMEASTNRQVPELYGYTSWKEMAIRRPHVLFGGCYLCRVTYVRLGDTQFTDVYRQFHLVVYYRCIRFFPDGRVCMLTSAHAPNAIVAVLGQADNSQCAIESESSGISAQNSLLRGTYVWSDPNFIICTLSRVKSKERTQPLRHRHRGIPDLEVQLTFIIRFRLTSSKRHLHSILHWDSYEIHSLNLSTQTNHLTTLDVTSDQFPSCHFSPVRSYTSEVAVEPL